MGARVLTGIAVVLVALLIGAAANGEVGERPTGGKPKVLCWNKNFPGEGKPQIFAAPRHCRVFADGVDYLAGAVQLQKLHWKQWGAASTRSKAEYYEPMNADDPWLPVRVKLSKPIERCGRIVYSKATFRFPKINTTGGFRLWTC